MSRAIYHKGLTIEYDSKEPLLLIEGQRMGVFFSGGQYQSLEYPAIKAKNLEELAMRIIEHSPEFERRDAVRKEHVAILKKGVAHWNLWRRENPHIRPTLYDLDFRKAGLDMDLSDINFCNADLRNANLDNAILVQANFHETNLGAAKLRGANLQKANFCRTDLYCTDLSNADLTGANLQGTQLSRTKFAGATLIGCTIYGLSAWDLDMGGAIQKDLNIIYRDIKDDSATSGEAKFTNLFVDDIQVAQFIYLLLNNQNFRNVIEVVTSKAVLILGRFTDKRKKTLDAIREELRRRNFVPILFDFEKPANRDLTETVSILAKLSRFVIADLTDAKSIPQELSQIIPFMPNLPVIPIILKGRREYAMFEHWRPYPWVLPVYEYENEVHLISTLPTSIIEPAEEKLLEIREK